MSRKYVPPGQEYHFAPQPEKKVQPDDQEGRAKTREIYVTESYLEQREIEAQKEVREVESFTRKEIEALGEYDPPQEARIESAKGQLERRREKRRTREEERREEAEKRAREKAEKEQKRDVFTPGRRRKPKPGSIADQIDKALRPIFEKQEEVVTGVSTGMRVRGKMLMGKSRTLATGKIEDFPEYMGVYMGAVGYRFGAGFVEGVTFVARPLAWGRTIQNIITVAQRPGPAILAAGYEVISDPFGAIAEVGGALAGGYAAGRAIDYTLGKYQRYRQAKFDAGVTTEDFLPYEEFYRYPSEVDLQEISYRGLKQKMRYVDDTRPYDAPYLDEPSKFSGIEASDRAKWGEISEGGTTLMPKGKYPPKSFDKKLWKRGGTAIERVPELIPPMELFWDPVMDVQTIPGFTPGLRIVDISPTVSTPFTDTARMLGTLGATKALTDIKVQHAEVTKVKVDIRLETVVTQDVRLTTIQPPINEVGIIQDIGIIQTPDVVEDVKVKYGPAQIQKFVQVQELSLPPVQEQKIVQEAAFAIPMMKFASVKLPRPIFAPRFPRIGAGRIFDPLKKRGEFRTYPISLPKRLLKMRVK